MTIKDSYSYFADYSHASNRVIDIYMSELKELNMKIHNTIYDELESAAATGFEDGWLTGIIWVMERFEGQINFDRDFAKASANAKQEEMKRRFYLEEK